jgi:hypothetical protein
MNVAFHFSVQGQDHEMDLEKPMFGALLHIPAPRLHVWIRQGFVMVHDLTDEQLQKVADQVTGIDYPLWTTISAEEMRHHLESHELWAFAVDGLTPADGIFLHRYLDEASPLYLGAIQLTTIPMQWALYNQRLPAKYRVIGRTLRMLHGADEVAVDDERDHGTFAEWAESGFFESVTWENIGIRGTIFDVHDTPETAMRTAQLESAISMHLASVANEINLRAVALDPILIERLHAAVTRVSVAKTAEDLAKTALAARRFLKRLADILFPPQAPRNGRELTDAAYRNRLWAYIEDHLTGDERDLAVTALGDLGNRLDRLDALANKGVHADEVAPSEMNRLLFTLLAFAYEILTLSPLPLELPSVGYNKGATDLMLEMLKPREPPGEDDT